MFWRNRQVNGFEIRFLFFYSSVYDDSNLRRKMSIELGFISISLGNCHSKISNDRHDDDVAAMIFPLFLFL